MMWPLLALASPVLLPKMLRRNRIFKENRSRVESVNQQRIDGAQHLDLPELDFRELTVLVDEKTTEGFRDDPGTKAGQAPSRVPSGPAKREHIGSQSRFC
jgi:hypothetical protein